MSDEHLIERAQQQHEMQVSLAIAKARGQAGERRLEAKGSCHNCDEVFNKTDPQIAKKLFCDAECGTEWEEWQESLKRKVGRLY